MAREEGREVVQIGSSVFDLLKNDHRTAERIVNSFMEASLDEKEGILSQLDAFFVQHTEVEERVLYPRLRDYPELADPVRQALAEHERLRDLLQQMETEESLSEGWVAACDALEDALDAHVRREEEVLMPQAQALLPPEELERMKELVLAEQEKRAQPHRHRDSGPKMGL